MQKKLRLLLIISILLMQTAYSKSIPLDNKNIHVIGAVYILRSPTKLFYKRFSEKILNMSDSVKMFNTYTAETTSGIIIEFKTNSSFTHFTFSPEPGGNEGGFFRVLKDGAELKTVSFRTPVTQNVQISLDSLSSEKEAVYQIILPSYSNLSLTNFEIDDNSNLVTYTPAKRKIYLGFGDSITHGRGQGGSSYFTYPFLLSQKLDMNLYNLAIGGSKVSIPIAEMSKDLPKADVITILIGYNDFNGASHTLERFEKDYREFLSIIRKNQPKAKIFCINLLYTKKKENQHTHLTPEDFRHVIEKVVTEYQASENKLFLIKGDQITSAENLQPGLKTDAVHLTVKGAQLFADALYKEMAKFL
ncbi:MAG TPA: SGNH/GDSL hydrolase family protein [Hanamia sp.]|nr:SGNH/GDSL hydrolase family protein [Hanamia sp.]